ncbi:aldo/keto reductase [Persephonella sp.]
MIYKEFAGFKLSEIGIGTYLGNPDEQTDKSYRETIIEGVKKGITVIDTALNYRNMRSEKVIGEALEEFNRNEVVISTKGGYVAVPYYIDKDPTQWFKEELVKTGIVHPSEITQTGNILTEKYINWAFEKSLENLKTDRIDVYFVHNPEDQLLKFGREEFYSKLQGVFSLLENKVKEGKLRYYGIATWNGLRVPPESKQYLNLGDIHRIALSAGGENHHFRFIQLPYNIAMLEAFSLKNQTINGEPVSTLEAARKLGLYTYISAPLMQGRLIRPVAPEIMARFGVDSPALIPLQFVRSTPGVGTVLVGTSKVQHLEENLRIGEFPPLPPEAISQLIESRK